MRKFFVLVICFILCISTSSATFAQTVNSEAYIINSIESLKESIGEMNETKFTAEFLKDVNPNVLNELAEEKMSKATDILEGIGPMQISYNGNESKEVREYDLGDGCWLEIELSSEKINNRASLIEPPTVAPLYFQDQSGHNPTAWKTYGDYCFTAKATVFYLVASATVSLKNYYNLSSNGIRIIRGESAANSSGLMNVNPGSYEIINRYARTPGTSEVSMTCPFQISYGYSPIEWSKTAAMYSTVRYADIDTINDEIHVTEVWEFKKNII